MRRSGNTLLNYGETVIGLLILPFLYLTNLYSIPLFHTLAELFSIFVAFGIFVLTWYINHFQRNNYLLILGISYFFTGTVDLLHTLAFGHINLFAGYNSAISAQFWIGARYIESISLMLSPLLMNRKLKPGLLFAVYALLTASLVGSVFLKVFPVCFVEGVGVTAFKVISEYLISILLVLSAVFLTLKRRRFERGILYLLILSIVTTILSELTFTFLVRRDSLINMIGHFLKIISFYLIYKAVIQTGLYRPFLELKAEKERLSVTLASIGESVITTDVEGRVELCNGAAEKLTGWTREEICGEVLDEKLYMINDKTSQPYEKIVEYVLDSGEIFELENNTILVDREGREKFVTGSAAPIIDMWGEILGVVVILQDVTQKRWYENELFRAENLRSISVLAGGIAHDFNNILAGLLSNAQLARVMLKDGRDPDKYLNQIEENIMRATALTRQLLNFSKGGAPVKKTVTISQLIKDTAQFSLSGSSVRCDFVLPEDLWPVDIDQGQISQVINNLVINAVQAMPDGGRITISAENVLISSREEMPLKRGRYVKISVRDEGVGISKENLMKIFQPFFTTKEKGNGLGLSTSYSIIKRHGGHMTVESELGVGSIFYLYLPASSKPVTAEEAKSDQALPGKGRIILLDDEETIRVSTGQILSYLGYDVKLVRDGREVIELYKTALKEGEPFDAVIMDLTIPGGMGGKETITKLLEIDPSVKAIVSSGYTNNAVISEYKKYGFYAAVEKPLKIGELSEILHNMIMNSQQKTAGII